MGGWLDGWVIRKQYLVEKKQYILAIFTAARIAYLENGPCV
jgi:hypothetical protein